MCQNSGEWNLGDDLNHILRLLEPPILSSKFFTVALLISGEALFYYVLSDLIESINKNFF